MSKGFKFTFLSSLCWSISIIVSRFVLKAGENPYNITFWTTSMAFPYWFYVLSKRKREIIKATKKDYLVLLSMGLISSAGVGITEAFALKYGTAISYAFLIRTVILFTILFAYLFLGEKLTLKKIILATLILAGAYLLTLKGQAISFSKGDVFTIIEAALIAFGNNILGKIATNSMSPDLSASGAYVIGVVPLFIIALINNAITVPKSFLLTTLLTILYILMANFRFRAYKNASATYVTMVISFTPVFVSFMAIPLLGETLTPIQIIGGALIISAGIAAEKLKI